MDDYRIDDEISLQSIINRKRTNMNSKATAFELTFDHKIDQLLNNIQVIQEEFEEKLEHCDDSNLAYLFGKMRVYIDQLADELNKKYE